jgi:hypothetical protein
VAHSSLNLVVLVALVAVVAVVLLEMLLRRTGLRIVVAEAEVVG